MNRLTVRKSADGLRVFVEYQPDNGTRYVAVGVRVPERAAQWLVGFPELGGGCWYFEEGSTIDYQYAREKYPQRHFDHGFNAVDASEMAKVISYIVPGARAWVLTDNTGHILDEGTPAREFKPDAP